jgi:hypothetical protein
LALSLPFCVVNSAFVAYKSGFCFGHESLFVSSEGAEQQLPHH